MNRCHTAAEKAFFNLFTYLFSTVDRGCDSLCDASYGPMYGPPLLTRCSHVAARVLSLGGKVGLAGAGDDLPCCVRVACAGAVAARKGEEVSLKGNPNRASRSARNGPRDLSQLPLA